MNIPEFFKSKKELNSDQQNRELIGEYIDTIEALDEITWLDEKSKKEGYELIAQKILGLTPKEVKVFKLSDEIYAKRSEETEIIEDSEIKDLSWAEGYSEGKD